MLSRKRLRQAVAGAAVAIAAVSATAAVATPASAAAPAGPVVAQQVRPAGEFQWVGPFDSKAQCQVILAMAQNGDFCQWNPYPPDTGPGWWYMHE